MAAPRKLRVAVVGVGHLGSVHARIYAGHEGVELVCVVDADEERARKVAAESGPEVAAVASVEALLEFPGGLDAVSIVVPTKHHAAASVPLLERGIPALVEKPLATDVKQAKDIIAAAQRGGAQLAVGHVERFQPGVLKVREMQLVPRFIECHRLAPFSFRSTDVGVVHDLMIHDLDLVLDLIGSPVESLDASGGAILTEHEDVASVRLVFANGARANVTASRASLKPMRRFRLFSPDGYVSLDFTKNYGLFVKKGARWSEGRDAMKQGSPPPAGPMSLVTSGLLEVTELELGGEQRPLQAELDAFITCVREGSKPAVGGEDGLRALELAERIAGDIRAQGW